MIRVEEVRGVSARGERVRVCIVRGSYVREGSEAVFVRGNEGGLCARREWGCAKWKGVNLCVK